VDQIEIEGNVHVFLCNMYGGKVMDGDLQFDNVTMVRKTVEICLEFGNYSVFSLLSSGDLFASVYTSEGIKISEDVLRQTSKWYDEKMVTTESTYSQFRCKEGEIKRVYTISRMPQSVTIVANHTQNQLNPVCNEYSCHSMIQKGQYSLEKIRGIALTFFFIHSVLLYCIVNEESNGVWEILIGLAKLLLVLFCILPPSVNRMVYYAMVVLFLLKDNILVYY